MRRTKDMEVRKKTGGQLATLLLIYLLPLRHTEQTHCPLVKPWDKNVETHPNSAQSSSATSTSFSSPFHQAKPIQKTFHKPRKDPQPNCCNTPGKSALLTRALQHTRRKRHGKELLLQGGR